MPREDVSRYCHRLVMWLVTWWFDEGGVSSVGRRMVGCPVVHVDVAAAVTRQLARL